MATLLEIREKIRLIYVKVETFFVPFMRFLVAFIVLKTLNGHMGYMARIDSTAIELIAALTCSFLPSGAVLFFAALFSLMHMYALSIETLAVGLVVYLLIYLLYLRFAPKESIAVVLTPLLLSFNLPCVIPLVMGLIGTPASAVSVGCGVIAYAFLKVVTGNASAIVAMGSDDALGKLKLIIDALMANKPMLVYVVAFGITVVLVYILRRLSIAHAWTIAITAGAIVNLIILLVGDMVYSTGLSAGSVILSTILAVAVAKVLEFFQFCLDYNRTERVQFEDDDYYYYVKAVPKLTVPKTSRTVKRINQQTYRRSVATGRAGQYTQEEPQYYEDDTYYEEEYYDDSESDVNEEGGFYEQNGDGGVGVDASDDFEELF